MFQARRRSPTSFDPRVALSDAQRSELAGLTSWRPATPSVAPWGRRPKRWRTSGTPAASRTWRRVALVGLVALLAEVWLAVPITKAEQQAGWGPLEVAGHRVAPGETIRFFVDIAQTVGGANRMLDVLVVVTRGTRPGPTLCLIAGIHGDELNGVEIAHRIYAAKKASELSGTLIAIPAVNMPGLRSGMRYLPDRRDLNRAFPGNPDGSLASRMAHTLYQGVIHNCDALIDLHTASASRTNLPQIRTDLDSPAALALARSFGVGVVLHGRGPSGSLRRTVLDAGVPAVIYEAGEPLRFEEAKIARGVEGIENVMGDLGMIGREAKRKPSEVYRQTTWVRAGEAVGIYLTERRPGDYVNQGDVLGTVTDPATEKTVEILAPREGRIIGMAVPQLVLPGYGLFHLGFEPE